LILKKNEKKNETTTKFSPYINTNPKFKYSLEKDGILYDDILSANNLSDYELNGRKYSTGEKYNCILFTTPNLYFLQSKRLLKLK